MAASGLKIEFHKPFFGLRDPNPFAKKFRAFGFGDLDLGDFLRIPGLRYLLHQGRQLQRHLAGQVLSFMRVIGKIKDLWGMAIIDT